VRRPGVSRHPVAQRPRPLPTLLECLTHSLIQKFGEVSGFLSFLLKFSGSGYTT